MNWINSWKKGNKKNKIILKLRFGYLTIFDLYICASRHKKDNNCKRMRLMILNFGFEF